MISVLDHFWELTLCLIIFQGFTCIASFNDFPTNDHPKSVFILSQFYIWGNWDSQRDKYTLLKVTQLVRHRVKIQIWACVNPDAESSPLPNCRSCPKGAYGQPTVCRNHHTRSHTLSANCVMSDSALSLAAHIQQSPSPVESAAQLGNGSGSLPFNPPLAPELAQYLLHWHGPRPWPLSYSTDPKLNFYQPAFLSLKVNIPSAAEVISLLGLESFTGPHSLQSKVQIPQPGIQGSSSNLPFQSWLVLVSLQVPSLLSSLNTSCTSMPLPMLVLLPEMQPFPNLFPKAFQSVKIKLKCYLPLGPSWRTRQGQSLFYLAHQHFSWYPGSRY